MPSAQVGPPPESSAESSAEPAQHVSVILPVHNGEAWLDSCLGSILRQSVLGQPGVRLQLSAFDDGSSDGTWAALQRWAPRLEAAGVAVVLGRSGAATGGGCGFAKNLAAAQSSGEWLCFQDVDDDMMPNRIELQLAAARQAANRGAIIGSRVLREPEGSTARYTAWANGMSQAELSLHRFRECTLLMPTWFMARSTFEAGALGFEPGATETAGGDRPNPEAATAASTSASTAASTSASTSAATSASAAAFAPTSSSDAGAADAPLLRPHLRPFREEACEDLLFLQAHVARGGALHRVDEPLVLYRYHAAAASHAIPRRTIHLHRVRAIEEEVLQRWPSFSIWGAGRDGREFFKALRPETRSRVTAFCDVDPSKVGTPYQYFEWSVPVVHFREVRPPFVTCVALGRTGGAFEANLASLGLTEGRDYFLFG